MPAEETCAARTEFIITPFLKGGKAEIRFISCRMTSAAILFFGGGHAKGSVRYRKEPLQFSGVPGITATASRRKTN